MTDPTPQTWTLRLKSHRTTILLHTTPLTPFRTLKRALHTALLETGLRATESSPDMSIPSDPDAIQFGRPVDPLDLSQGWELGEWEDDGEEGVGSEGKARDCPKGAGLKDGAVLAFRWEGDGIEGQDWGVKVASFEDAYGVVNEMDGGARGEFEG